MSLVESGFRFVDVPAREASPDAVCVRIRGGVRQKRRLLGVLARGLRFPDYFGWNWDALEECLRDLSWIPEGQPAILIHDDVPFVPGSKSRRIYLVILNDAVNASGGRLSAVFPKWARDNVQAALRDEDAV